MKLRLASIAITSAAITSAAIATATSLAAADTCDLSSDAGVDAAYKAATGHEMSTYGGRCAERSSTFPAMYVLGTFLSDRGCRWEGTLHHCTWNDPKAAVTEMAAAGWAKADAKKRGELAIAWLREIDQVSFTQPSASVVNGKTVVDYWVWQSAGMRQAPTQKSHLKIVFEADGTHGAPLAY
jgi:hypothetical protein